MPKIAKPSKKSPTSVTSFLLSLGNSDKESLGLCIRITMPNGTKPKQVVETVRTFLKKNGSMDGLKLFEHNTTGNTKLLGVEYVHLYVNYDFITVQDLSSGDTETVELK